MHMHRDKSYLNVSKTPEDLTPATHQLSTSTTMTSVPSQLTPISTLLQESPFLSKNFRVPSVGNVMLIRDMPQSGYQEIQHQIKMLHLGDKKQARRSFAHSLIYSINRANQ